jgi:hypothetical protein
MNVDQIILKRALNWCNLGKNVNDARKVFVVVHFLYFMYDLINIFTIKHQFLHLQHLPGAELMKQFKIFQEFVHLVFIFSDIIIK